MGADQIYDFNKAAASTLDWWHEAGVDLLVEDSPRDWLVPAAPPPQPVALAPIAPSALPDHLDAFLAWRGGDAVPEAAWPGVRIAASGPADARLMVLVDMPDREDGAEGRLLGGPAGRLFDRMLAAAGQHRDTIHLAAVCTTRPIPGRIPAADEPRLAEIARHYVGLVGPKRLIVLGGAASRAILATDVAQARGRLHGVNHKGRHIGVVASFHPRFLLEQPARKAEAWKDWILATGGLTA